MSTSSASTSLLEHTDTTTVTNHLDRSFFGHPRGLATLFLTEMWERFSYYGMRALLILFMTASPGIGGLGFPVPKAAAIYGLYTASVYLSGLPGGWIADRVLGLRGAVLTGGVLIALGHYSLIFHHLSFFYLGLALIVLGTGLLKSNISAIVGQLYASGDVRRDAGFSLFYLGINLGGFLSPLACGYLGQRVGWHWGFGLAAFGMTLAVIQFAMGRKNLGSAGVRTISREKQHRAQRQLLSALLLCAVIGFAVFRTLKWVGTQITAEGLSTSLGLLLILLSIVVFGWLFFGAGWTASERRRLIVILVLFVVSGLFWAIFEQAGSTLNLFAERNTNCVFLGYQFPASWFQSLGSFFIILLAPVFVWFWLSLGNRDPSSPRKFAAALVFAALGFAVLILPLASGVGRVSPWWLVLTYLLHTAGELCLSPVGLSAMTKLAPERAVGLIMGVWFLSTSAGNYLGSRFAGLYEAQPLTHLFTWIAMTALSGTVVLSLFVKRIERLMFNRVPSADSSPR
jgi:POT family proton-dependent oligopeptide transporter